MSCVNDVQLQVIRTVQMFWQGVKNHCIKGVCAVLSRNQHAICNNSLRIFIPANQLTARSWRSSQFAFIKNSQLKPDLR